MSEHAKNCRLHEGRCTCGLVPQTDFHHDHEYCEACEQADDAHEAALTQAVAAERKKAEAWKRYAQAGVAPTEDWIDHHQKLASEEYNAAEQALRELGEL